ncbi:hypothetical protein [Kitasatospora sp. NPDC085879]|uniref:hypothetical protein n=1 Tax=Kitasatospora sp. NPDC085879 TaxID=3154769 RepID=UPI00343ED93B
MSSTQYTPHSPIRAAAGPQISLLAPDYTPAVLDGQILAVPLHPHSATEAFVPALIDGQVAAVPVHNPLTVAPALQPITQLAAPAQPAADPGLPLVVRHYVLYGSAAALAAGGVMWMAGAAVAEAAPHADQIGEVLRWAAIAVGTVVVGLAVLLGNLRSITGPAAGTGASATASGDGATATGAVLALVHRTHQTTIGKQSAGWRGSITNNNG